MNLRHLFVGTSIVGVVALGSFVASASDSEGTDPAQQVTDTYAPPNPPWVRPDGTVDVSLVPKAGLPEKVGRGWKAPDGAAIETQDGQVIDVPVVTDPSALTE